MERRVRNSLIFFFFARSKTRSWSPETDKPEHRPEAFILSQVQTQKNLKFPDHLGHTVAHLGRPRAAQAASTRPPNPWPDFAPDFPLIPAIAHRPAPRRRLGRFLEHWYSWHLGDWSKFCSMSRSYHSTKYYFPNQGSWCTSLFSWYWSQTFIPLFLHISNQVHLGSLDQSKNGGS